MKTNKYKFRGKIIESDPATVKTLNLALTFNGSRDRYVKVSKEKDK